MVVSECISPDNSDIISLYLFQVMLPVTLPRVTGFFCPQERDTGFAVSRKVLAGIAIPGTDTGKQCRRYPNQKPIHRQTRQDRKTVNGRNYQQAAAQVMSNQAAEPGLGKEA